MQFLVPKSQRYRSDDSSSWLTYLSVIGSWWRHQMETFSALLAICAGNSPVPGEFPAQRPVTQSFGVFFDLCLNKRLSKQSWGWWFETLSRPFWRHRNRVYITSLMKCWYWKKYSLLKFRIWTTLYKNGFEIKWTHGNTREHFLLKWMNSSPLAPHIYAGDLGQH